MKIFILAAGIQRRFPHDSPPKQLLAIANNETILSRQLRQLGENIPTVITKKPVIKDASPQWYEPKNAKTIVDTVMSVRDQWQGRIVYLLGDVIYSDEVINEILQDDHEIRFWMSGSEIFAFSFLPSKYHHIRNAAEGVLKSDHSSQEKRLWVLYRALNGMNLYKHVIQESDVVRMVVDSTMDIDSIVHYQDYLKGVV